MPDEHEPYQALWNRALWYLGRRDYGTKELRERLLRPRPNKPPADEADVGRAIARLTELGLLDDERRAARLAETLGHKGWSARKIAMELRFRGLPEQGEPPEETDAEVIARLLATKYAAKLINERGQRATYQALRDYGEGLEECADDCE